MPYIIHTLNYMSIGPAHKYKCSSSVDDTRDWRSISVVGVCVCIVPRLASRSLSTRNNSCSIERFFSCWIYTYIYIVLLARTLLVLLDWHTTHKHVKNIISCTGRASFALVDLYRSSLLCWLLAEHIHMYISCYLWYLYIFQLASSRKMRDRVC